MPRKPVDPNLTIITNVVDVIENKKLRQTYTFVFLNGDGPYLKDGRKFTEKEVNDLHPISVEISSSGKGEMIGKAGWFS